MSAPGHAPITPSACATHRATSATAATRIVASKSPPRCATNQGNRRFLQQEDTDEVRTEFVHPPIPDRRFDWSAVDDDTYDGPGSPIGLGSTEEAAIADPMLEIETRRRGPVETGPVCGFSLDEECPAPSERGYCPRERGETGISERDRIFGPYKAPEPNRDKQDIVPDDFVPF